MDYKEKYEHGLECIQEILSGAGDSIKTSILRKRLQPFFPERQEKESEDERIRKAIIAYISHDQHCGVSNADMIAWLEKQGQEPKKVSIWKHWKNGIAGNGEGKQTYLIKMGNTYNLSSCLGFECDYIELSELDNLMLEKQGEQKPTENAKKLDANKVIKWLNDQACLGWLEDVEVEKVVEQFKKDFGL